MSKSIIQPDDLKECYLCGRKTNLERHHIFAGVANRRLSEKFGLWIYLCHDCHTGTKGAQYDADKSLELKRDAQMAFEEIYGNKRWMDAFKKNYL